VISGQLSCFKWWPAFRILLKNKFCVADDMDRGARSGQSLDSLKLVDFTAGGVDADSYENDVATAFRPVFQLIGSGHNRVSKARALTR
jgi:hypothetical protein